MFDGTEYWCKIWRKTDLCSQKWHRNLAHFHQSMFESLKIGTLMGSFCHDKEEWCKIGRGIDLSVWAEKSLKELFDGTDY